jgi:4-carboxymuconolactone decarboxylase
MSRLSTIPPDRMTPEQRKVYEESVAAGTPTGTTGGPYTAYIRVPDYMRLHREVGNYLRRSSLPARLRQLLVLTTCKHWGAKFPWAVQVRASLQAGLEQLIIDALDKGQRPALSSPKDSAAYQFARELLETKQVSDATYKQALEQFNEAGLVDIVVTIGSFTTTCLTANAFDIDPPSN